jgi:ribonuclease P protein component
MLPFKNRLTKKKDHEKVQKLGYFVSLGNIAIKSLKNDSRDTRIGIVVGLKFSKKSIERNQVKRVLRDIVHAELKNIEKGWDIIIMARKRDEEKSKNINFKKNILTALEKGNLLLNKKDLK